MSFKPHWYLLGPGAIGSIFASYLHQAQQSITLLLRDHLTLARYQKAACLTVEDEEKKNSYSFPAEIAASHNEPIDQLIITVKAHQVIPALKSVMHRLHPQSFILLSHNGLGVYEKIKQVFPELNPYFSVTTTGGYRIDPFHTIQSVHGSTWAGRFEQPLSKEHEPHLSILDESPMQLTWDSTIENRLWDKLTINACINPLAALLECKNGELLKSKTAREWLNILCDEIYQVRHALGHAVEKDILYIMVLDILKNSADNHCSMLQDIQSNRLTEIDSINGYLCQKAKALSIDVPLNEHLVELIYEKQPLGIQTDANVYH